MSDDEGHIYWAVACKTQDCDARLVVAYAGIAHENTVHALPWDTPQEFDFNCPACGITHRYKASDLKPRFHPTPPPEGFAETALF